MRNVKATKSLAVHVVVFVVAVLFFIIPMSAYADTVAVDGADVPAADTGGVASPDLNVQPDASETSGNAFASGATAGQPNAVAPDATQASNAPAKEVNAPDSESNATSSAPDGPQAPAGTLAGMSAASVSSGAHLAVGNDSSSKKPLKAASLQSKSAEANIIGPQLVADTSLVSQSATDSGALNEDAEIDVAKIIIEGIISGSASGPMSWTGGKIMTAIFGSNLTGDVEEKLDQILKDLAQIEQALAELQKTANAQELDAILNSMSKLVNSDQVHLVYNALSSLNDESLSEDEYYQRLKSILTENMGNGNLDNYGTLADPNNTFDTFAHDLWVAMTVPYHVTINGQPQELTLMQVYYERLRLKYKWEHQAYDEWKSFNNRCVSLLAAALSLERASLKMRLDLLRNYNSTHSDKHDEGAIIALLNDTQDQINQVKGFAGTVNEESRDPKKPVAKTVDYPGLFNTQAWNEQYWMYKERPDFRYYWVPGHECLFYPQVNTQDVPPEQENVGLKQGSDQLRGIRVYPRVSGGYNVDIIYDYWKPFLNYQGGDSPLVNMAQLKKMYADYGSSTHLYNIFMDKENGNFFGLDEGDISHWWFVVGQTKQHQVTYDQNNNNSSLYTYVVSSPHAEMDTIDLARYNNYMSWSNPYRHYIGIGVVRYGPETYNPKKSSRNSSAGVENKAKAEVHTAVLYELPPWHPSDAGMELMYDSNTHGNVNRVFMDGVEVTPSSYTVVDGRIVLTSEFLASLDEDEHELLLETDAGSHTIVFRVQADVALPAAESNEAGAKLSAQVPKTGDEAYLLLAVFMLIAAAFTVAVLRARRYE